MIIYKTRDEIEKIRAAGRVLARTLRLVSESIVPGKTTTADLDALTERLVAEAGGACSFKNYRGFPASICVEPNDVVVHGIPGDRVIQEGDILGIDLGVYLDGWHADSANTYAIGEISPEAQRLLNVTKESLYQGIAKARVGNTIGDIGAAVQKYCESNGYGVVRDLVGHGIGRSVHEEPNVPNFGKAGKGITLREGMILCIEPMINQGTYRVKQLSDKWTVVTADGKLSAHFEHTIAVTKDGPDILTLE